VDSSTSADVGSAAPYAQAVPPNRLSPDARLPESGHGRLLASTSSPRFSTALGRGVHSIAVGCTNGLHAGEDTASVGAADEASFGGAHPHPLPTTGICSGGRPDRCAIGRRQVKLATAIDQE
jgi:hypothetical protein